ncbi:MAG: calcineurin-like phosphoesterase C-terminal domain-containing protein [Coprobacter sp.]|nr:calcineurin-like phosphoesterase C-terminal domain-containing protein [Coprobacter sp.]
MKKLILSAWLALPLVAQAQWEVTGTIYRDKNGNGVQDNGERGLKNIPVSNGDTVVLTNRKGEYRLTVSPGESVFPILPPDYTLVREGEPIENAHYVYFPHESAWDGKPVDFALYKTPAADAFDVAAVGDVQVGKYAEENYAGATVLAELAERRDIDFNIFLGDLTNHPTPYLQEMKGMLNGIPYPSWTVIGNHDRELTHEPEKQESVFNGCFGASTYAFNRGKVHFIVINNVLPVDKRDYTGGYSDKQLRFLKNDLERVPRSCRIVICQHIPMVHTAQKAEILDLLKGRGEVMVLSGHTHRVRRHFIPGDGVLIHELGAGASCGTWWTGERDWQGIPAAIMPCGSPRGYFVVHFDKRGYDIRFKGVGLDKNRQMDIWVKGLDAVDNETPGLDAIAPHTIVANVYGGSDSTAVEVRIDGGAWRLMRHTAMPAPNVSRMIHWNKTAGYPTQYSRRIPMRKEKSAHIWCIELPEGLAPGAHTAEFRASDRFGLNVTGSTAFVVR